jgi:NAD(P)-dependent dehydrogenase (short-subunit alcohol dehydrogenase family)
VFGAHLDMKSSMPRVQAVIDDIAQAGVQVKFVNKNIARDENRLQLLADLVSAVTGREFKLDPQLKLSDPQSREPALAAMADAARGHEAAVQCVLHSVAFGSLLPFVDDDPKKQMSRAQLEMTLDVMANSLVYWVEDLARLRLIGKGSKIYAMTSSGSHRAIWGYGPVSSAKAALEAHIRQLALELGPRGVRVNAIQAGVTDTPALRVIPGNEEIKAEALRRSSGGRLTTPEDVANTIVALMDPRVEWVNGSVIRVDCGEDNM